MKYTYDDALNLLTSGEKFQISLGLERMYAVMKLLDNPQDKLACIHVAGTNGKGSVCAALASILHCTGKKTGLYTSPHIFKYTERIQINGNPISDKDFAQYVFEISDLADKNNIGLTEFEILTAVMFKYFYDNRVDIAVLETGLGGRFDATNIIKQNLCSVITHIDLDHTERLGDTIDKIAYEKAGIIKPNCPCIAAQDISVLRQIAKTQNSRFITAKRYDESECALKGIYQKENISLAIEAIKTAFADISEEIICKGLSEVKHPFRFQYLKEKNLIIDGAHNPDGMKNLIASLDKYYPDKKRRFIFGCLNTKDYKQMLEILTADKSKITQIYFYRYNHPNSCTFEQLQAACPINAHELTNSDQIDFNDGNLNVICGSLYMIAQLCELFDIDNV